jgi:hypothetical protein
MLGHSFLGDDSGIDWGDILSTGIKTTPTIISSIKGQSYGSSPYGPSGGGGFAPGGFTTAGAVPGLGGGSFSLDSNTILLLGLAVIAVMFMRK